MPSAKEKMLAGDLYSADDPVLQADQEAAAKWMVRYNASTDETPDARTSLLEERFGAVGPGCVVRPPFHCDYGYNIHLGTKVFLNFNCVVLDVVKVSIGDMTQIGPGVQILTADHPRDPRLRQQGLEFGREIEIGANVWIGAGAIILPGITIGDDALIGAGALVTKDVAAGVTVVGVPARPVGI